MSDIIKHRLDDEIPEEFQNLADRTAQDMVIDHVYAAYEIIKSIHPEVAGFQITLKETGGGNAVTSIDLLKLEEES